MLCDVSTKPILQQPGRVEYFYASTYQLVKTNRSRTARPLSELHPPVKMIAKMIASTSD